MRRSRFLLQMTLVGAFAVVNGGCLLIPQIKEKNVELAVAGTVKRVFKVTNSGPVDTTETIDFSGELNLQKILDDAGISVGQVKSVKLSGVSYRIKTPEAGRQITNGNITVRRLPSDPWTPLATGFAASAGAETGFIDVPLAAGGVTFMNALLAEILSSLQGGPAVGNVEFRLSGDSSPSTPNNFEFELKIKVSITGKITVKVLT